MIAIFAAQVYQEDMKDPLAVDGVIASFRKFVTNKWRLALPAEVDPAGAIRGRTGDEQKMQQVSSPLGFRHRKRETLQRPLVSS